MQELETIGSVVSLETAIAAVGEVIPSRRRERVQLTAAARFDEDLGLSSLDVAEVFVRLEELVGRALDTSSIEQTRTIGDLMLVRLADDRRP